MAFISGISGITINQVQYLRLPGKPIKLQFKLQLLVTVHLLGIRIPFEDVVLRVSAHCGECLPLHSHLEWPWVLISVSLSLIVYQNQC